MTALRPPLLLTLTLLLAAPPSIAAPSPFEAAEEALKATDHDAARRLYAQALASPATLPVSRAYALARYGLALRQVDRHDEALLALNEAVAAAQGTSDEQTEAAARRYRGRVFHERGELERAREDYARARAVFERLGPKDELLKSLLAEAALVHELDRAPEAYERYADALELARTLGDTRQEEASLFGLAWILGNIGETATAVWLVEQARSLAEDSGEQWRVQRAGERLAEALYEDGRLEDARRLASDTLAALPTDRAERARRCRLVIALSLVALSRPVEALQVLAAEVEEEGRSTYLMDEVYFARAEALLGIGRVDEADRAAEDGRRLAVRPAHRARGLGLGAQIALRRGERTTAVRLLEQTLALHEWRWEQIRPEHLTRFAHRNPVRHAETLLMLYADQQRVRDAIVLARRLKSRAFTEQLVRDRLAGSAVGWTAERRLRERASLELLNQLPTPQEQPAPAPPVPLLDFYQLDHELLVFVQYHGLSLHRLPVERHQLSEAVDRLHRAVVEADPEWLVYAEQVSAGVLRPLEPVLSGLPEGPLAIVPHRALHRLSFALLPHREGLLIDRFAVFYAPSAAALATAVSGSAPPIEAQRALLVGDAEKDLPEAFRSSLNAAARFPGSRLLLRGDATEEAVRRVLPTADVVHFAVHGHQSDGTQPAYVRLRPTLGFDGRLEADEVLDLSLRARLVVLSACETGVGRPILGDEIPGVLDRAFLLAGADAVISTRWRIDDLSARLLTDRLYAGLPEKGRLGAFVAAQRALRNSPTSVMSMAARTRRGSCRGAGPCGAAETPLSHPYHWAGFTFLGDHR